jgi:hypothetical protein
MGAGESHDPFDRAQLTRNLVDDREELRPDEQKLGTRVVEDVRDFGWREARLDSTSTLRALAAPNQTS